jgi:hypothetical protein
LVVVTALAGPKSPSGILFTQTGHYDAACADRFPDGASIQLSSGGRVSPFVPGFAASADPAVSFDGRNILFAGKQKLGDAWQIWEVAAAGGSPRRITRCREDTIAPFYAGGERIVYARRTASGFRVETSLMGRGGEMPLTYLPGDFRPSAVLRDGRVLFEGPHPGSAGRDLFTVYIDGSGVETYRCDHRQDRSGAAETVSGDIVFVADGKLARFTSARAVQIDLPPTAGEFAGRPAEIAPGEFAAAYRTDARQPFGIYRWKPGQGDPERFLSVSGASAIDPVLLQPHDVPKRHPSALGDRDGANLLCLNVYTSKSRIARGSVASVRVWALDDGGGAVTAGTSAVESDGSYYVQVPADRGIRFELLDRAGKTVEVEKGWFWARRGEQRVCVGCHAGPERAPDNVVPKVLVRSTEPTRVSGGLR